MRTTKGAARNQAKKRLFKKTKGFRGGNRRLLRTAKESLVRAGVFAFRDRRVRKRNSPRGPATHDRISRVPLGRFRRTRVPVRWRTKIAATANHWPPQIPP